MASSGMPRVGYFRARHSDFKELVLPMAEVGWSVAEPFGCQNKYTKNF